ncbi:MAG: hypothetical protein GY787_33600 [Alteromonadales bacterium]|nr:hypothetical protein [Alteromonadales bacterium]
MYTSAELLTMTRTARKNYRLTVPQSTQHIHTIRYMTTKDDRVISDHLLTSSNQMIKFPLNLGSWDIHSPEIDPLTGYLHLTATHLTKHSEHNTRAIVLSSPTTKHLSAKAVHAGLLELLTTLDTSEYHLKLFTMYMEIARALNKLFTVVISKGYDSYIEHSRQHTIPHPPLGEMRRILMFRLSQESGYGEGILTHGPIDSSGLQLVPKDSY